VLSGFDARQELLAPLVIEGSLALRESVVPTRNVRVIFGSRDDAHAPRRIASRGPEGLITFRDFSTHRPSRRYLVPTHQETWRRGTKGVSWGKTNVSKYAVHMRESRSKARHWPFRFDPRRKQLFKGSDPVPLKGQIFKFVEYLFDHPGNLVTYEELKKELWQKNPPADWQHDLTALGREARSVVVDGEYEFIEFAVRLGYRLLDAPLEARSPDDPDSGPHWGGLPKSPVFVVRRELNEIEDYYDRHLCNVVCVSAPMGGEGKSQLIRHWISGKVNEEPNRFPHVFCYCFNSQGTSDVRQTNSEEFFKQAYRFFKLNVSKGVRVDEQAELLAQAIRNSGAILYLDGIEPLQEPTTEDISPLEDVGVAKLLENLAVDGPHLCLLSTRRKIADLQGMPRVKVLELNQMRPDEAVSLLEAYGVRSETLDENTSLSDIAKLWNYHPLSLSLLGAYAKSHCRGDIRSLDSLEALFRCDSKLVPYRSKSMLDIHEHLLKDKPELQVLRVLGLFDRDIREALLWRLTDPPVHGLSDLLHKLWEDVPQWNRTIDRLANLNLIIVGEAQGGRILHCHPLVREYQNERLKTTRPDAWRTANRTLFAIFQRMVRAEQPESEEDIFLLYRAIAHGCAGGLYKDSFRVYQHRVLRGEDRFSADWMGLVNEDLKALRGFAKPPLWTFPTRDFSREERAEILGLIGFRLRTLGRMEEAGRVLRRAMKEFTSLRRWRQASTQANNLAVMLRMQGRLGDAIDESTKALSYARKSRDRELRVRRLVALGELRHYKGEFPEAEHLFKEAEEMRIAPHRPHLRSTLGFRYCEFLLNTDRAREALKRARFIRIHGAARYGLLNEALEYLCEGRAMALLADGSSSKLEAAEKVLRKSCAFAKRSMHPDNRIRAAVALAEVLRTRGKNHFEEARKVLTNAERLAQADGLYLHQLDCEYELLCLDIAERHHSEQITRATELAAKARDIDYGLLTKRINMLMETVLSDQVG
jgi:DNA-binding winged helix-turn-helix (wHTH) protein/tetratricopeptide (TPR) repeat protein